ncbi:hypothetical protein ACMFMG_010078 [Clarireedia jacksonii]
MSTDNRPDLIWQNPSKLLSRTTKAKPARSHTGPVDALEALFEDAFKKGPNELSTSTRLASVAHVPPSVVLQEHIKTLSEMLRKRLPLRDCWSFFLLHFGPSAWKTGTIDRETSPTHLNKIAPQLLKRIMEAKSVKPFSEDLPTYTELTLPFFELGILFSHSWAEMMNTLLVNILEAKGPPQPLIMDLLMSWNIVCRQATTEATANINPSSLDWSYVPWVLPRKIEQFRERRGIYGAFSLFVPTLRSFTPMLSGVVLGTIKVLLDIERHSLGELVTPDTSTLLKTLLSFVYICRIELGDLSSPSFKGVPQFILQAIKDDWVAIKDRANTVVTPMMAPKRTVALPLTRGGADTGMTSRRLASALDTKNRKQAEDLWMDAQRLLLTKPDGNGTDRGLGFVSGTLSPALYHQFILTFMGLRSPAQAIEVWNHMVENGITPDLGAWDAMLNGCKASKDANGLKEVWSRMISTGVKPDIQCWTSRISGLIWCRKIEDSIYALDEMGRLWLQAVRKRHPDIKVSQLQSVGPIPEAVKPTIATVNAAVSGLLKQRQTEAAHRVLAWASKIGISPDVQTYNLLLQPLIREGRIDQVTKILKAMQAQDISPDAATFVAILEDVFRDAHNETPDQLKDIVKSVFAMMEEAGVEANLHTYNKIIYMLLQANPNDITPISAVMEHMASRDVQPNTHTYTMLATHYFTRQPPDLEAVRILIERARLEVGTVDHIFWDRVIEGYAWAGDTATALRLLEKTESAKSYISWDTLRTLLMALIQNDEWELARELVRNTTKDRGGPISINEKGVEGQHKFWELAQELRLVDKNGM